MITQAAKLQELVQEQSQNSAKKHVLLLLPQVRVVLEKVQ